MIAFEVLPGLPGVGPLPEQFAREGRRTHSEGYVVRFVHENGETWVGNFQPGMSDFKSVLHHPNGRDVVVIANGEAYIVDPIRRQAKAIFGSAISNAYPLPDSQLIVFDHQGIQFEALGPEGTRWRTRRLSWDGFADVSVDSGCIRGKGWSLDHWRPFEVDLATGRSSGGGFRIGGRDEWEKLDDAPAS